MLVLEPIDEHGRTLMQEECCTSARLDPVIPHLLSQVCEACNGWIMSVDLTNCEIEGERVALVFSWIFGEQLAPLVDQLIKSFDTVWLIANPSSTAPALRSLFPDCVVTPATSITCRLRPSTLDWSRQSAMVQYSSGCPLRCPYCVWAHRYVLYDPFDVAATVNRAVAIDAQHVTLLGNELSGKVDWLSALASQIPKDVTYNGDMNVANMTQEDVTIVKRMNVVRVCLGIEFLTDTMLQRLNKNHSVTKALDAMGWLQDAGIVYRFSLRSSVGETTDDLDRLLDNLHLMADRHLTPENIVCGHPMVGWHGTPWAESVLRSECVNQGSDRFPRYVMRLTPKVKAHWKRVREFCRKQGWLR